MPDMMGQMDIAFPNLGIYLGNVPKNFEVFGFTIALYGVIIATGMMIAVSAVARIAAKEGLVADEIWNVSIWVIVFSILGARAYYVIFSWDEYKNNFAEIINIRNGGLAIYGGIIAGFCTFAIYSRIKKLNFLRYTDVIVNGLLIGQILGRWGNFTNREAFGEYTNSLFAMRIPLVMVRSVDITPLMSQHILPGINYIQVHPTFLYESFCNLCILILLIMYRKSKKAFTISEFRAKKEEVKKSRFDGEIMLMYLGGYGIARFFIEGLRTDQLQIGSSGIAVSQMLGIILFAAALIIDLYIRFGKKSS